MLRLLVLSATNCLGTDGRHQNTGAVAYIDHCYFYRSYSYSGNGGCIMIDSISVNMIILDTTFNRCSCSVSGGVCFFVSTYSSMARICAYMCQANGYHDQFGFFQTNDSKDNEYYYLSVSKCAPENDIQRYNAMELSKGNQKLINSNFSCNCAKYISSVYFRDTGSVQVLFSSFESNTASDSQCITFRSVSGQVMSSNLIKNKIGQTSGCIIHVDNSIISIKQTFFKENTQNLFISKTSSIDITQSMVYHEQSLLGISIDYYNNSFMYGDPNFISHLSTHLCPTLVRTPYYSIHPNIAEKYSNSFLFIVFIFNS